jgi:hypothetical protein
MQLKTMPNSHFETLDNGATVSLRCSDSMVDRPYRHCLLYPTASCGNRKGIIVTQPLGTLTSWLGNRCEHTNSVDAVEFYNHVDEGTRVPSIGVIAAQRRKLSSVSPKNHLQLQDLIYWPAF